MLTLMYLLLVHIVVCQSLTQEDASGSFRLCVDDSVPVEPKSSGTIEYRQSDGRSVGSCSLVLRGFNPGSYMSLPGVDAAGCLASQPNVIINNESYCVKEGLSDNTLIIRITHTLSIKLPSPGPTGFSFEFYNNVATCGQENAIPDIFKINQLSGILANSYNPNTLSFESCQIKFKTSSRKTVFILFQILHITNAQAQVHGKQPVKLSDNVKKRQLHTESSINGEIVLVYNGVGGFGAYSMLVKYSVLYCNTKSLQLANATITPAHEIMLAGSMSTFTYSCVKGLMLNGTRELNVECMADEQGQTALHQQDSLARECVPATCDLSPNFTPVANGNITTTQDTYSYKEELKYECDDGYSKNGSVVCGDEGVWSGTPGCVQSTTDEDNAVVQTHGMRFNKQLAILLIPSIGGLVVLVVIVVVVVHFCLRKGKKTKAESTTALDASGGGESQAGHNNSAGAYQEVSSSLERSNFQPRLPVIPVTSSQGQYDSSNLYSEVKVHGHENKKLWKADTQPEPVYETGPAVPPKLNQVLWEGNDLYDGVAGAREHQQPAMEMVQRTDEARQDPAVEMVDNDLYG